MKSTKVTKTISNMIETNVPDIKSSINIFVDMTYGRPTSDAEKREKNQLKIDLVTEYMAQVSSNSINEVVAASAQNKATASTCLIVKHN